MPLSMVISTILATIWLFSAFLSSCGSPEAQERKFRNNTEQTNTETIPDELESQPHATGSALDEPDDLIGSTELEQASSDPSQSVFQGKGGVSQGKGGVFQGKGAGQGGVQQGKGGVFQGKGVTQGGVAQGKGGVFQGKGAGQGGVSQGKGGVSQGKGGVTQGKGGVTQGKGKVFQGHQQTIIQTKTVDAQGKSHSQMADLGSAGSSSACELDKNSQLAIDGQTYYLERYVTSVYANSTQSGISQLASILFGSFYEISTESLAKFAVVDGMMYESTGLSVQSDGVYVSGYDQKVGSSHQGKYIIQKQGLSGLDHQRDLKLDLASHGSCLALYKSLDGSYWADKSLVLVIK